MSDTALEYLVGSTTRPDTLAALRDQGRLSIRGLEDRVAASRRTLKRTLGAMESRGWVRDVDGGYELTSMGMAMLSTYETCRERERIIDRFRPFLEHAPAAAFGLDIDVLADAELIRSDDDPAAPVDRLVDIRAGATRIRECAPFLLWDTVQQLVERVTGEDPPDVTFVLNAVEPTTEYTEAYRESFERLAAAPSVDIYHHPDEIHLPFGLVDGRVVIGALDADGMGHALVESEADPLVEWAEWRFEEYLAAATPLDSP